MQIINAGFYQPSVIIIIKIIIILLENLYYWFVRRKIIYIYFFLIKTFLLYKYIYIFSKNCKSILKKKVDFV